MTGGHRGVGGEGTVVPNLVHVSVEVMVKSQGNKGGMTFVHVVGSDSLFQSLQNFVSTYAQDCLLTNASMTVAAIEVLGHQSIIRSIVFKIGIQKINGNLPF